MRKAIVLAASFALGMAGAGLAFASEDLAKKSGSTLAEGKKHPATKVSDADRATLVKWVLSQ
jgi:hypothetical protein